MKDGQEGPCIIYEIKSKHAQHITISKLDGTWKNIEVPGEAERTDFWMGAWVLQMANVLWGQTPRQAALLVCQGAVIPPWTRLRSIQDFSP